MSRQNGWPSNLTGPKSVGSELPMSSRQNLSAAQVHRLLDTLGSHPSQGSQSMTARQMPDASDVKFKNSNLIVTKRDLEAEKKRLAKEAVKLSRFGASARAPTKEGLSDQAKHLLRDLPGETTTSLPPPNATTINRALTKHLQEEEEKSRGKLKSFPIMNLKAEAAEKARRRAEEAKEKERVRQEIEDRALHKKMMTAFAERTDNTLQARNQLRNIQSLLKEAVSSDGFGSGEEESDDEEDPDLSLKQPGLSPQEVSSRITRSEQKMENERFVDMLTGTTKKGGRVSEEDGEVDDSAGDPEKAMEKMHSKIPKKKLRVLYEGDDQIASQTQEELDSDPNIYTEPRRVYERQRQARGKEGIDDLDPQKLKSRYEGAAIGAAPTFSSASLSRIMETAVTDALEQRLATESILRTITDPQQKNWKIGSLEGEVARLMFHVSRLEKWCEAAAEQTPLYYSGTQTIREGSSEEIVQYRKAVLAQKEQVDLLERHTERQQLENDSLRREIGALKEEYLVKKFAMQINEAVPNLEDVPHVSDFISVTGGSQKTVGDEEVTTTIIAPGSPGSQSINSQASASSSGNRSSSQSILAPRAAVLSEVHQDSAGLVWEWSLLRLRQLLGSRRTKLQAAMRLSDDRQVTRLVDQRDISDGRSDGEIAAEIGMIDSVLRQLAPKKAPTMELAKEMSLDLASEAAEEDAPIPSMGDRRNTKPPSGLRGGSPNGSKLSESAGSASSPIKVDSSSSFSSAGQREMQKMASRLRRRLQGQRTLQLSQ